MPRAKTTSKKDQPRSLYFIGIKGVAMAGMAIMAKQLGYEVNGSDEPTSFPTDQVLAENQVNYNHEFSTTNLDYRPDLVVISAAYGLENVEVKMAKKLRLTICTQSELLGLFMSKFEGVGVAGVHGKTTTSSMLTLILDRAGYSPSYMIGTGSVPGLAASAHIGEGNYFVAESDEYRKSDTDITPKFLDLPLKHIIITSIELDHPDIYSSAEQVYDAFYRLSIKVPRGGTIVACTDWPLVKRLVSRRVDCNIITYGFEPGCQYQISQFSEASSVSFYLRHGKEMIGPISLGVPGKHNALNATAAALMAAHLGVGWDKIIQTLAEFQGAKRRFEYLGNYNGAEVYDDYAHHPTAISYLLESAKRRFRGKRIVMVFQPHTYSRTGKLLKEFAQSLKAADKLILLNIFASAREKSGYVTINDLLSEVRKHKNGVEYRSNIDEAAAYLKEAIKKGDVVLLVGAGDVYKIYQELNG